MNQILNKHHFTKGGLPLDSVYIGRGSIWANPYSHKPSKFQVTTVGTREEAIEMYRRHLWDQIKSGQITINQLLELDDKPLVCFCSPLPCHGEVLSRAVEWAKTRGAP